MKQVIFILLIAAVFIGCHESNSVEPIDDMTAQFKTSETELNEIFRSRDREVIPMKSNYNFDPCNNCGELLYGCNLEYEYGRTIDGITTRYLKDVKYFAPSTIELNGKTIRTCNIYTLNRTEKVAPMWNNQIIEGEVWGQFQVQTYSGVHPLRTDVSPMVLFSGEFKGDIKGNETKIKLLGKGQNFLSDRILLASENQVCNTNDEALGCISAKIIGKISPKIFIDE